MMGKKKVKETSKVREKNYEGKKWKGGKMK